MIMTEPWIIRNLHKLNNRLVILENVVKPTVLPFNDTKEPFVGDYHHLYSGTYGENPHVDIETLNELGILLERKDVAASFIFNNDLLLDSITFDLPLNETGNIIIRK
jgi:hypothetical protein